MADYSGLTPEEQKTVKKAIIAAATPARWPCFPELGINGEWTRWAATPDLRVNSPCSVEQPPWAKNPYQALSYCWGDLQLCTGIILTDGNNSQRVFRVTEDLATCLYSIVNSENLETPSYLWIDQICINQDDIIERNAQVQMMAEIYQSASLVIVWLGQEAEPERWQRCLADCSASVSTAIDGINKYTGHLINFSLFNRRWFTRVWVFQEIVLAKDFTLLIGQRTMRPEDVFERFPGTIDWGSSHESHVFATSLLHRGLLKAIHSARPDFQRYGYINLLETVNLFAVELECKDPRDRVYALLGCAPGIFPSDFVDYGAPVHEIFRNATKVVIAHSGSLEIIEHVNRATYESENLQGVLNGLPTWTPGWGTSRTSKLFKRDTLYQASGGRPHLPKLEANPDVLRVQGRIITTIMAVLIGTPKLLEMDEDEFPSTHWVALRELCRAVQNHAASIDNNGLVPYLGQDAKFETMRDVVHTVYCHDKFDMSPAMGDSYDQAELVFNQIIADHHDEGAPLKISLQQITALSLNTHDRLTRHIAVLSNDRLALVDNSCTKSGDKIAILHGLSAPCVLRKVDGKEEYTYHGDAFIKGMMQGEAMNWHEDEADTFTLV
ncbi:heterokaryon incompatibility protein-domain-containing protein [Paraphoma chrysanthemicola]|nr:heterokaryon incompatibility protein-domain-containing protein [Paraphoma chrysanthemicola]